MADSLFCVTCGSDISSKSGKNYNRFTLLKVTTPRTARTVFPNLRTVNGFCCFDCLRRMRDRVGKKDKRSKYRLSHKRPATTPLSKDVKKQDQKKTPSQTYGSSSLELYEGDDTEDAWRAQGFDRLISPDKHDQEKEDEWAPDAVEHEAPPEKSFKERALMMLKQSRYPALVRLLVKESPAAAQAVRDVVASKVQHEIARAKQRKNEIESLCQPFDLDTLSDFQWENVEREIKEKMPFFHTAVESSVPSAGQLRRHYRRGHKSSRRILNNEEAMTMRRCRKGFIIAMLLHSASPNKYKWVQACMAVEMWRQGASQRLFRRWNYLGMCQSVWVARTLIDRLAAQGDHNVKTWKEKVEAWMPQPVQVKRRLTFDRARSFTLCWDNVQWQAESHRQDQPGANPFHLMALAFAAGNRTESLRMTDNTTRQARELPLSAFLATAADYEVLRTRMVHCVKGILVRSMAALKEIPFQAHLPHFYQAEMAQKSSIISLGVIDANPSSHDGVLEILEHLQWYAPRHGDDIFPVLCNGDGLSVDRMRSAKVRRARTPTCESRLEGLIPAPQEFHMEALLLQDTMNEFFTEKTEAIRGTLYQLKQQFDMGRVKGKVLDNFSHVWHLLEVSTLWTKSLLNCRRQRMSRWNG